MAQSTKYFSNRYRDTPPFSGRIRKFRNNASEMKSLAARDFEDMLQVRPSCLECDCVLGLE